MQRGALAARIGVSGLGILLSFTGIDARAAAACSPESLQIDRGETRRLVLCAEGLPANATLTVPAGIDIRYQQQLRHCGVGDKRPGLQLVLTAGPDANTGAIRIGGTEGSASACQSVAVQVPDRSLLPDASLRREGSDNNRWLLEVPAGSADLSGACASPPQFPAADGLRLQADSSGRKSSCRAKRAQIPVQALDARQQPAKVVLSGVRRPDGSVGEAVVYAMPPAPAWTKDMAEDDAKFIDVQVNGKGIRTRYFEAGRGEPLLLVHGGQPSSMDGTSWDWQQNFGELSRHFHVYALDRLGQGYTDNPANLDEYQDYYLKVVEHVLGFMNAVGIEKAHLAGHSQGSWPVTRISLDHPERVKSLTLVDGTMVSPPHDGGSAIRFYLYLTQDLHPAAGETLESARRGMEFFSYSRNNLTDQRVERLLAMTRQPKFADSQAWFAKSMMSPAHPKFRALKQTLLKDLEGGRLKVPVLVVWGLNDPEGSLASGLALFQNVGASSPRARMHVFGRSGHLSFIEYPEEFNRVLTEFAQER